MQPTPLATVQAVTPAQMAAVDRAMADTCGLDLLQVMEVAGLAVAAFARDRFFGGNAAGRRVVVLAGPGGNGGDGLVAARYLSGWGATVEAFTSAPRDRFSPMAAHNAAIADRIAIPLVEEVALLPGCGLVIDALLGFSLSGAPTGRAADLIRLANRQPAPILAIDLPSGLDGLTGEVRDPCIRADATLTLARPKTGLLVPGAVGVAGETWVADIGVPARAWREAGIEPPQPFPGGGPVRIR